MKKKLVLIGLSLLIVVLSISPAFADAQEDVMLETLTVTAQKRAENVQDVPVSITAFSEESLDDAGINQLTEVARFSPNVYVKTNAIVIRGISQYYGTKFSSVGMYLDGVSLPFEGVFNSELFDIERIEILKGPQGTLYGRNSESGVINIITKQPDNEYRGKLIGEVGWHDTEFGLSPTYSILGNVSGPIVKDKLYLRLAGKWEDDKGYMKNVYNGDEEANENNNYNGRLSLKWTPGNRWDVSLVSDVLKSDYYDDCYRYVTGYVNEGRNRISYDGPYSAENEGNGQTLRIKYAGDNFDILSITGRRNAIHRSDGDFDLSSVASWGSEGNYIDESTNYSQEIRISSPESHTLFKWLVGVYAFNEEMDIYQKQTLPSVTKIRDTHTDSLGYAVFGQITYTLWDRLHLTGGLRYDYMTFEGEQKLNLSSNKSVYDKDFDTGEILPKVAISYDLSENIMTYASAARGYQAGGYNFKWATKTQNFTYDPEFTWNYEVGVKSSWLNKRLIANFSAFFIDMKDKQVTEWDTSSSSVSVKQIQNAANAYSAGVEFEVKARPAHGLDIFAGIGVIEAKIDDWIATEYDSTTGEAYQYNYNDNNLPNVPEYTYNLGIQYRHASGIFARADLLGTGALYSDAKNTAKEGGYELVNLRIGYETENFDIYLWCKNAFDEDYLQVRFTSSSYDQGLDGEPRMFGMTVAYRF